MFTLPPAPAEDTSIVDVSEGSETLQQLLQFCYPTSDPEIKSFQGIQAVLEAARKYEMDGIQERVAKRLEIFINDNALRVYAIAHRYKLERQVRLAAKQSLQQPLSTTYVAELEFIPASALYRFQDYHLRCKSATSRRFLKGGLTWVHHTRGSSLNVLLNSYIWFTCRRCPSGPDVKVMDNLNMQPTKWWSDYMEAVSSALSEVPCYSNEAVTSAKNNTLETAVKCSVCQKQVNII